MGDIYVYFYGSGVKPGSPDTVPLMLVYNNNYYRPETRDDYFEKWIPVEELNGVKPGDDGKAPCGKEPEGAQKLAGALDEVNRELNRIELDPGKASGQNYGLPTDRGPGATVNTRDFPTERVNVVEVKPTTPNAKLTYTRIVHRTKNGFTVGKLTSKNGKDITEQGLFINGASIKAGGSGGRTSSNGDKTHTEYTNLHKLNTVVVYYSETDGDKKLPQLMVLLHTSEPVGSGGDTPITGSATEKKYGYYIITDERGENYQYVWRPVTGGSSGVTLDDKTDFNLLNSVVILLERRGGTSGGPSYGDTEIKQAVKAAIAQGMPASPGNSEDVNRITKKDITVSSGDSPGLNGTGFKCWTHDISALVELNESLKTHLASVNLIGGLRFLIPTALGKGRYIQLKIMNGESEEVFSTNDTGLLFYHQKGEDKVCVFFYESDPRPLLLCYNKQGFKPKSKDCYFCKWIKDETVKDCKCDSKNSGNGVLKSLVEVSNFLNRVHIHRVTWPEKSCRFYYVHKFNGRGIYIKIDHIKGDNGFCYDRYTHTHYGTGCGGTGFRLGNIVYKGECIKENSTSGTSNDTCITASQESRPFTPSPEVVTYYYRGDKKYKNPLLVALCKKDGGGKYQPYYELQKSTGGAGDKKYKKEAREIKLEETVGSQLERKLNEILHAISQKLQVILDQRPLPQRYSPNCKQAQEISKCNFSDKGLLEALEKIRNDQLNALKNPYCSDNNNCDEEQRKKIDEELKKLPDYFFYHVPLKTCYQAQLYENTGKPVENGSTASSTTHVVVEEVRKCKELALRGYRCFKHDLVNTVGIEEVGGLKLHLYGDKEIELHNYNNGSEELGACNGTKTKKVELRYNTCKGDIYVYFYGDDPRPLMLCYDNKAYKPATKGSYEKKWVCVKGVENKCVCDDKGFEATQVLPVLYQLSMELNEVQLGKTIKAYSSREKPASHKYSVHTYNKTPVNVMVTGHDLSCYKQYTHRPQSGYRLGNICYNTDPSPKNGECKSKCKQAEGIKYDNHKQLISVSLYYYMYDKDHNWPLIVELGYKGELSDFFRLDDPGNTGTGGENGKTQIKWEKMTDKPDKVSNGHSCKNQQNGAKNGENGRNGAKNGPPGENGNNIQKEEKCQLDKEFAKQAKELQLQIYESERGIPWDHNRYWYRVIELDELIERRAYRIRKSLKLEYKKEGEDKQSNLILATDENCHEESLMGYVIGGGAVGVAGGGGWKAVSVM